MRRLQWVVLTGSRGNGLRHSIKCRSLDDECGVWVEFTLSMILRLFTGIPYRLGLLAFKGNGNGAVSILVGHVYGVGWCIVGWCIVGG